MCDQNTSHKTNQVFGPAQLALLDEEYEWAKRFLQIKDTLPGGKTASFIIYLFFFTSTPNPCKNLNNYFQEAWKAMKLLGCPTFTDLRTSIASHISVFSHNHIFLLALWCQNLCAMMFKWQINFTPPTWRQNRPWSTGSSSKRHWRVRRWLQASHKPPASESTLRRRQLRLASKFCRSPPLRIWRRAAPPPLRLRWSTRSRGFLHWIQTR